LRFFLNLFDALRRSRGANHAAETAPAWYRRANASRAQGKLDDAVAGYRRALELDPRHDDARFNLATTLIALDRAREAEPLLRQLAARTPAPTDVLQNLGIALARQERHHEAEPYLRAALAAGPANVALLKDLALVLHRLSRDGDAIEMHERAIALEPGDPQLHSDAAELQFQRGELARARHHFERALALAPGHRDARIGIGRLELLDGNIMSGWPGYRLIMRGALVAQNPGIALDAALPAELTGKTVLLLGEQGIGDELIFLRYAQLLKQRGATVFYRAESRVGALLQTRTVGIDRVLALADVALPARDFTLLSGDLPQALATGEIPPAVPLTAQPQRVSAMRERLTALGPAPYLGLTWRAGLAAGAAHNARLPLPLSKHIALPQLAAALQPVPGTLLALQREPQPGEIAQLAALLQRPVHDFRAAGEDLEDTLALLALLDEYVGVSNTNMHLLAGLGKTARVLMPCPPDWRWMAAGKTSPWFPGFAIYRQNGEGDWRAALDELRRDLLDAVYSSAKAGVVAGDFQIASK